MGKSRKSNTKQVKNKVRSELPTIFLIDDNGDEYEIRNTLIRYTMKWKQKRNQIW